MEQRLTPINLARLDGRPFKHEDEGIYIIYLTIRIGRKFVDHTYPCSAYLITVLAVENFYTFSFSSRTNNKIGNNNAIVIQHRFEL